MSEYAVELENITKRFGAVVAVKDVTLSIRDGEFFSLLGPSGCGKTTTLRLIAGFEEPTRGEVRIQGQPMGDIPPYQRPVNTVFQNYALFPHMNVFRNVAFGLEMQGVPKDEIARRAQAALELVELPGMGNRRPRQLSGGQQQRVALARALINQPAVLLLDEPLGALDLKLRKAMQLELKHMQERVGITFIYVTHDQEEALTMSDRIAVMNEGVVLQVGPPQEIYEQPRTRFVADFIGETNFLPGLLVEADQPAQVLIGEEVVVEAELDHPISIGSEVTVAIRPEKINLLPVSRVTRQADGFYVDIAEFRGTEVHNVVVPARVEETIYIGTDTRYIVSVADTAQLMVRVQNFGQRQDRMHLAGSEVYLHWLAENARVLTE